MNIEYYSRLKCKLTEAYDKCCQNMKSHENVILTKRELEDLYYLWNTEAPKIWKIKFAKSKEGVIKNG